MGRSHPHASRSARCSSSASRRSPARRRGRRNRPAAARPRQRRIDLRRAARAACARSSGEVDLQALAQRIVQLRRVQPEMRMREREPCAATRPDDGERHLRRIVAGRGQRRIEEREQRRGRSSRPRAAAPSRRESCCTEPDPAGGTRASLRRHRLQRTPWRCAHGWPRPHRLRRQLRRQPLELVAASCRAAASACPTSRYRSGRRYRSRPRRSARPDAA
jgi:hypothetical protein